METTIRRSKWKIILNLLKNIKQFTGKSKTYIMYQTNLSFFQFKEYTKELEEKGMIEVITSRKTFKRSTKGSSHLLSDNPKTFKRLNFSITKKGLLFLQKIEDMIEFWENS